MENYNLLELIGVGSFGRVFKATDKRTLGTVALKFIALCGRSAKDIARLTDECAIQRDLHHPHIVRMLHSFVNPPLENDGGDKGAQELVIVTEYAQDDLRKLLKRETNIPETRARRLACDLISALHYLHSERILHRDLKPENILLDAGERAKLCDFGLARHMTADTHVVTSIKGTPLYMAPEVLAGKPYDHQADLWSLGCIVYETIKGEAPFSDARSLMELAQKISTGGVLWSTLMSEKCLAFLSRLLEKDAAVRMSWSELLEHVWVRGEVKLVDGVNAAQQRSRPLTEPLSGSLARDKERQRLGIRSGGASTERRRSQQQLITGCRQELNSSMDSLHAVRQSDIETGETDAEDAAAIAKAVRAVGGRGTGHAANVQLQNQPNPVGMMALVPMGHAFKDPVCFVSGNANLIVNNLNDNFVQQQQERLLLQLQLQQQHHGAPNAVKYPAIQAPNATPMHQHTVLQQQQPATPYQQPQKLPPSSSSNRDLERRKLNQNLENFSVRQQTAAERHKSETNQSKSHVPPPPAIPTKTHEPTGAVRPDAAEATTRAPTPPMDNDEWMAFLQRSMQEVLDGELDSLRQQNIVSIVVARLRNPAVSVRVMEAVAQLLSLPLVLLVAPGSSRTSAAQAIVHSAATGQQGAATSASSVAPTPAVLLADIRAVYAAVKLVPNLVFASIFLCTWRAAADTSAPDAGVVDGGDAVVDVGAPTVRKSSRKSVTFKLANQISADECRTLLALYELCAHLVHLGDQYLQQFCDAIAILGAGELLANLLAMSAVPIQGAGAGACDPNAVRLGATLLGILCLALRERPEQAALVERIVLHPHVRLADVLGAVRNALLRKRWTRMLRMLGRFSCSALQAVWTADVRAVLERWLRDGSEEERRETQLALKEFMHMPFYNQAKPREL